jgi:hypothetical protein
VLLFLFSITPKKYLHDLLANHTDSFWFGNSEEATVSKKGINCNADDLVVKASFLNQHQSSHVSLPVSYSGYSSTYFLSNFLNHIEAKDSRGPPALSV